MQEDPAVEFDPLKQVEEEKIRIPKPKVNLETLRKPLLELQDHIDIPSSGLQYLQEFISMHQMWAHSLYPGMRYEDFCKDIDKLSTTRDFKEWHHEQIREEMGILANNGYENDEEMIEVEPEIPEVVQDSKKDYIIQYDEDDEEQNKITENMDLMDIEPFKKQQVIADSDSEDEEKKLREKRKNAMELLRKRRMEE